MAVPRTVRGTLRILAAPAAILGAFWTLGIVLWWTTGHPFGLLNFGYIGTAVGVGMGLYMLLPKKKKPLGRKLAQFLVGVYMLGLLGLVAGENMQIEGFFFFLLAGFVGGAVTHYLVAKIVGPILFGRAFCAWACWTAMILDLLPWARPAEGRRQGWGAMRYVHFAGSLVLVGGLWFIAGYEMREAGGRSLAWLVSGNVLYYALAIGLAAKLRDNRAFCKYVCPVPVLQKGPSRFALLKIGSVADRCNDCGACERTCPMDIRIRDYIRAGRRVTATECIFCLTCTTVCVRDALTITFAADGGGTDRLRLRDRTVAT